MEEKASEVLGPSLIAPTRPKNPPYRDSFLDLETGAIYSCDGLRIGFAADNIQKIIDALDSWLALYYVDTYTSNRIGSYRFMWVWDKADAVSDGLQEDDGTEGVKLVVGFGLVSASGKSEPKGFVEFNPNKCAEKPKRLIAMLDSLACDFEVRRYDLAVDFEIDRDGLRMVKDKRKYGCEISNGMTEYLGQRNAPGRVKVYDKRAEMGLDYPLTRVELTCSGEWSEDGIMDSLPVVYCYESEDFRNLRGVTKAFSLAVMANCKDNDEVVETWLRLVDKKTRSKVRKALRNEGVRLGYSYVCVKRIKGVVASYIPA